LRSRLRTLLLAPVVVGTSLLAPDLPSDETDLGDTVQRSTGTERCHVDPADLTVAGDCRVLDQDASQAADPTTRWGAIDCEHPSRDRRQAGLDDPHLTALGQPDGNAFWREMTVRDGDDFYGERCELGRNEHRDGQRGTFTLYRPETRRITFFSIWLPHRFDRTTERWQVVAQMKQANPSDLAESGTDYGYSPVLEMTASDGRWALGNNWNEIWDAPARSGTWVRFAYDVRYSIDSDRGWVRVFVDLNGDGDALDRFETTPKIHTDTLKTEIPDPDGEENDDDGIRSGEAIPSHLRVGIYHDPAIDCQPDCRVRLDNVQVVAP